MNIGDTEWKMSPILSVSPTSSVKNIDIVLISKTDIDPPLACTDVTQSVCYTVGANSAAGLIEHVVKLSIDVRQQRQIECRIFKAQDSWADFPFALIYLILLLLRRGYCAPTWRVNYL